MRKSLLKVKKCMESSKFDSKLASCDYPEKPMQSLLNMKKL